MKADLHLIKTADLTPDTLNDQYSAPSINCFSDDMINPPLLRPSPWSQKNQPHIPIGTSSGNALLNTLLERTTLNLKDTITITSQSQLEQILTNITSITGNVVIQGDNIYDLQALKRVKQIDGSLEIKHCPKLKSLHGLENITTIKKLLLINDCPLPDLSAMKSLTSVGSLKVRNCDMTGLFSPHPDCLIQNGITIEKCNNLRELSGITVNDKLYSLYLRDLENLDNLNALENLQTITESISLDKIPNIGCLYDLKNLSHIEGILEFSRMQNLKVFDHFRNLRFIKEVSFYDCNALESLPTVENTECVNMIQFHRCNALQSFPKLEQSTGLAFITIWDCPQLDDLTGLQNLNHVYRINFTQMQNLENLTALSHIKAIDAVHISSCPDFKTLHGIENCHVKEVHVDRLPSFEDFSALKDYTELQTLSIHKMDHLTHIIGLENIKKLKHFAISRCPHLKNLRDLKSLKNQPTFRVNWKDRKPALFFKQKNFNKFKTIQE